jgi:AcrR family transcriptional regulator
MPRPAKIQDADILAAAREVFLEKGIRATTAEVAKRAGIAEGSIFNRFPTKLALFNAAMRPTIDEPVWVTTILDRVGAGDLAEHMTEVGVELLEFLRSIFPLILMSWSNPPTGGAAPGIPEPLSGPNPPPLRALRKLGEYFDGEMRAGRLRRADPELLARIFLGSLQNYVFTELVLRAQSVLPLPSQTYVRGVVDLLLHGAGAPAAPRPPAPGGKNPKGRDSGGERSDRPRSGPGREADRGRSKRS